MPGSVGDTGTAPICISLLIQYYWHEAARFLCARQGNTQREGYDAMPMRRTIGISFACLVTSACATSKTPEESTSHYADEAAKVPDPCCRLVTIVGRRQFGKAAWYDFVGKKTASGEILDSITATAAHRSLPLASYAKVTDLDNSRSVIVR